MPLRQLLYIHVADRVSSAEHGTFPVAPVTVLWGPCLGVPGKRQSVGASLGFLLSQELGGCTHVMSFDSQVIFWALL